MVKQLTIDITDWADEFYRAEIDVSSEDAAIQSLVEGQIGPSAMGRHLIAAREEGAAPADILPENKLLLNEGAASRLIRVVQRHKEKFQVGPATYHVRSFVGSVRTEPPDDDDDDDETGTETFVRLRDPKSVERAREYLERVIPRHIMGRLLILAANGESVAETVENMKSQIDSLAEKLVAEPQVA